MSGPLKSSGLSDLVRKYRHRANPRRGTTEVDYSTPDASMTDVYNAYELLLRRLPDPDGLAHYRHHIENGHISRDQIVTDIIHSPEFAGIHVDIINAGKVLQVVDVGYFKIRINPLDGGIGSWIANHGGYEPEVSSLVRSTLRPGDVVVDVGANIGWFSLLAATVVGAEGKVIAVEPDPDHCESITDSAQINGFHIDVETGAASDKQGWIALQNGMSNGWVKELGPLEGNPPPIACNYVVPQMTLDSLISKYSIDRVDLMKVDVEGFEPRVFRGAENVLDRFKPRIVFEWYPESLRDRGGFAPGEPTSILRAYGYQISVVGSDRGPMTDDDLEAERQAQGRQLLELLAEPPS